MVDIEDRPEANKQLTLDPEWLCILQSTDHLLSLNRAYNYMPNDDR